MSIDIVKRLRQSTGFKVHHTDDGPVITADVELLSEAADKIERLRAVGDALVDAVLLQRWSTVDVAVANWLEARHEW